MPAAAPEIVIRAATRSDDEAVWRLLEPVIRAAETYALPPDLDRDTALEWWFAPPHQPFVAMMGPDVVGTYYLQPNQRGPGEHVANCGYVTDPARAGRGLATAMCRDSLQRAASGGFRAMQFNLVVSTNARAVRLWQELGFAIVGTIPEAFRHPTAGYVDAHVMHRAL